MGRAARTSIALRTHWNHESTRTLALEHVRERQSSARWDAPCSPSPSAGRAFEGRVSSAHRQHGITVSRLSVTCGPLPELCGSSPWNAIALGVRLRTPLAERAGSASGSTTRTRQDKVTYDNGGNEVEPHGEDNHRPTRGLLGFWWRARACGVLHLDALVVRREPLVL